MTENGIDRLFRLWPEIVQLKYPDDPEAFKANATTKAARHWFDEANTARVWIGHPNNPDHVALAYIIEAARHMCGMDHAGALRLLNAAIKEIQTDNQ